MSKIEDIYDALVAQIETVLPGYARLPNPYDLAENPAMILKKAYGIAVGAGTNTERYTGCLVTWERTFTIGLVTQVVNTESDTVGRANIEKDLLEAHELLLIAIEKNPGLSGESIKAVVTDDSGIEYLVGQNGKYLAIEITVAVEYQEPTS